MLIFSLKQFIKETLTRDKEKWLEIKKVALLDFIFLTLLLGGHRHNIKTFS